MSWVAAAVAGASIVYGGIKSSKAKKEARKLQANRPVLEESQYTRDELALTKNQLATGMSGAASNAYEQGLDRDLSSSINAILQGGGDGNNVAELFDRSQVGRQRLTLMKENLRLNNIQNYIGSLRNSTGEDQNRFKFNEWAPYADAAQANSQARQGAEQQIWSGVSTLGSSLASGITANRNANEYSNYFGFDGGSGQSNGNSADRSIAPSMVTGNNGMSQMANNTQYINPNYLNNRFASNINDSAFNYENNNETPTLFQKF